jgi:hypothetical protein
MFLYEQLSSLPAHQARNPAATTGVKDTTFFKIIYYLNPPVLIKINRI